MVNEHQGRKEDEYSQVGGCVELPGTVPVDYRPEERSYVVDRGHSEQQPGEGHVCKHEADAKGVDDPRRQSVQVPALALGPLCGQPLGREGQSVRHTPYRVFPFGAMP